ncbi:MAG: iron uptake porin [Cyanobacteria bacterium]|jgi:hypothetical protein|nr:iron uptake porin [Cyanobacteria bacterium GSL.Bin1]
MSNIKLTHLFKAAPILLGASFIAAQAGPVFAQSAGNSEQELLQQIDEYNNQGSNDSLNQVNSVFQLRDVSPGDWAFEALRNLVERYGCIAGYPDGTYRGDRALTRYEFAAGLNACLQQIERLIAANQGQVSAEDLAALERLMQEFEAELATLGTRVDNLEGRVGFLEDNQFSTTTKLNGSVVFMNTVAFGDDLNLTVGTGGVDLESEDEVDSNVSFLYDAVLDFNASFTGRDELKVSFQAADFGSNGDFVVQSTGTNDAALDNSENTGGSFELEDLIYTFPLGDKVQIAIGANDMDPDETFEYNFGSGGEINDFTQDDIATLDGTIGFVDEDGAGISTNIALTDRLSFGVGYTVDPDDSATDFEVGLFQDYVAAANLNYAGDNFDIGVGYTRGQDGTNIGDLDGDGDIDSADITQNAVGARGAIRLGSRTEIGGWATYVDLDAEANDIDADVEADGWNFGANVAFFDLGKEGSKLGLAFASPTFFSDVEGGIGDILADDEEDRTYIGEISYDFPLSDNISITPGFFAVFNPNRDEDNDTVYVGVLRTSFSF